MGQVVVNLHLDDLRVDHDETERLGRVLENEARDDGVDADALAATGRAGHEQVGHRRQVGDDGVSIDILAERQRKRCLARFPGLALEELADADLDLAGVGDLDADGVLAGNGSQDIDPLGAGGAGEVPLQG